MKIKRFLSVLLIVMVAVGMFALPAAAAVKDATKDVTLTIYALEAKSDSEVAVDVNVTGEKAVLADVRAIEGAVFALYKVGDDETSISIPKDVTPLKTEPTAADGSTKITVPAAQQGRYLVIEDKVPDGAIGKTVPFLVDLPMTNPDGTDFMYDVFAYPKQPVKDSPAPLPDPKVSKLVSGDEGKTWGQEANIEAFSGKRAYWKVTGEIPATVAEFDIYEIGDILDNRLIAPNADEVKASIDGKELPADKYTVKVNGQNLSVNFDVKTLALYPDKSVDIIFPTAIDVKAKNAIGVKIENIATLTFTKLSRGGNGGSSDTDTEKVPGSSDVDTDTSSEGGTDTDIIKKKTTISTNIVKVWTGSIEGFKHDKDNKPLEGAEFTLYEDKDCKQVVGKAVSDKKGIFTFTGLKDKTYYLKETKAPDGYQENNNVLEIKIDGKSEPLKKVDVVNIPKTDLPVTGGAGIIGISLLGIGIALAGVVIVIATLKAYKKARFAAA